MKPALAHAIMALAALGGGDWPPPAEELRPLNDRRRRPESSPSLASLLPPLPPVAVPPSPAAAERVRLADEKRARKAAKLEAAAAKGAIRRAGT